VRPFERPAQDAPAGPAPDVVTPAGLHVWHLPGGGWLQWGGEHDRVRSWIFGVLQPLTPGRVATLPEAQAAVTAYLAAGGA
jgi:hypothetical protein